MKLLKPIIAILSVFLSISFGITLAEMILPFDFNQPTIRYFLAGFGVFIPFWFIWFKNKNFYSTFEHELTHLLVGLLFFKKPAHFTVTRDSGGETGLYGGNFLITLAPYFLPNMWVMFSLKNIKSPIKITNSSSVELQIIFNYTSVRLNNSLHNIIV